MLPLARAVLLGLALAQPIQAADVEGRFAIRGAGRQTCADFTAASDSKSRDLLIYGGWVDGYATGLNQFQADSFDVLPWQTTELVLGLLAGYCKKQPQTRFIDAMNAMIKQLFALRLQTSSDIVSAQIGGQATMVYADVLRQIKARLVALGHDPGPEAAGFSDATAQALRAFQRSAKLPETGQPDQKTLFELFLRPLNQTP